MTLVAIKPKKITFPTIFLTLSYSITLNASLAISEPIPNTTITNPIQILVLNIPIPKGIRIVAMDVKVTLDVTFNVDILFTISSANESYSHYT